jgi:hypothetical protein
VSGPVEIILIIAVVGYILARRLLGEPAEAKRMLLLPAVLTVIGLVDLTKVTQSALSVGFLVGTTAVSILLGLLRGASIRVFDRGGVVYLRYTATTIVLWVLNLAIKFGAGFVLGMVDPKAEQATSSGLMFTLGAGLLVEGLAVLSKAVRSSGRIVWAKGRDGQPHTMSPTLDGLQQRVRTTDRSQDGGGPRRRGGLGSLIQDLRTLDVRQPIDDATTPYDGTRPGDGYPTGAAGFDPYPGVRDRRVRGRRAR